MQSNKPESKFYNYSLGRLLIKDFKSFDGALELDFSNQQLTILDGPNGFGKTSIFDAIEVSMTGKISRIIPTDNKLKDRHLLINDLSEFSEIYLELINGHEDDRFVIHTKIFDYKGSAKYYEQQIVREILGFWPGEEEHDVITVPLPSAKLQDKLNYQNIDDMFTVLNYIQQEDALHYLKDDEATRYKKIQHLMGKAEGVDEKEKLELFNEKLSNDIKKDQANYEFLNNELKDMESMLIELPANNSNEGNVQLSGDTIDVVITDVSNQQLEIWLAAMNNCKLIFQRDDAYSDIFLKHCVIFWCKPNSKKRLSNLLNYANHGILDKTVEKLQRHIKNANDIIVRKQSYTKIVNNSNNRNSTELILAEIRKVFLKQYDLNINLIESWNAARSSVSSIDSIINILIASREKLHDEFLYHHGKKNETNDTTVECPFCGKSFEELTLLNEAYSEHEKEFFALQTAASLLLTNASDNLWKILITPLVERSKILSKRYANINRELISLLGNRVISTTEMQQLQTDKVWFDKHYPDYIQYSSSDVTSSKYITDESYNLLVKSLSEYEQSLRVEVEGDFDLIQSSAKLINLKKDDAGQWIGTIESIENDILCLTNHLTLRKNNEYLSMKERVDRSGKDVNKLKNIKSQIDKAIKIYRKNIESDDKSMSKAIRIPFYVYSSKILQTRISSKLPTSGIILRSAETAKENPFYKFCAQLNDKHDVWNTMSSGQLAGVVISFMLTMNKVYPSGLTTLLIDDPVQSMDDINMASFVHLLRGEFNRHQVILSTHDSKVANYLAFKYQASNLKTQHINLKKTRRNRQYEAS